jgi:hypothetical protein
MAMSSYQVAFTFPVPVASVVPAAVYGANAAGLGVKSQAPYAMTCKSGLTIVSYPVTIDLAVSGVDGAAIVSLNAHNFGFGPLQTGACKSEATKLLNAMSGILQTWAAQAAWAAATPPTGSTGR